MEKREQQIQIPETLVTSKIYIVRDKKIMLDRDLAELYDVETKVLNQAVKRNSDRFPEEFMFQLTTEEFEILKSQIVTSSWGGTRYLPMAFTEYGVAMLSSVLRSKTISTKSKLSFQYLNGLKAGITAVGGTQHWGIKLSRNLE
jgi:hypothetical protein